MQDKTINRLLDHLHRECMNGRHKGLYLVWALMKIRGVEPTLRGKARKLGHRNGAKVAGRAGKG